ncbi:MAG: hypothetical protein ACFCUU_03780 [Cyclobacteriaceae bacterium]
MIVKTKKYKLPTGKYIKIALAGVLKQQWWVHLIVVALMSGAFFIWSIWWIIGPLIAYGIYILFWLIQFAGVTQLEQGKLLFEKLTYEINSQQILIKLNPKQGMPMKWDQIKRAQKRKDDFVLFASKAQIIHWPYKIFNNDNDRKFVESILKRKGLLKVEEKQPIK